MKHSVQTDQMLEEVALFFFFFFFKERLASIFSPWRRKTPTQDQLTVALSPYSDHQLNRVGLKQHSMTSASQSGWMSVIGVTAAVDLIKRNSLTYWGGEMLIFFLDAAVVSPNSQQESK